MKRIHLIAGIILILGATYAIEYYANTQFSTEVLKITGIPDFNEASNRYDYYKSLDLVGTYTYSVKAEGATSTMKSVTDVSIEAGSLELGAEYAFGERLNPVSYKLSVVQGDEMTHIETVVIGDEIVTSVTSDGGTLNITDPFEEGVLLVDINMPGFWEILFNSANFIEGVKYTAVIYIPQVGAFIDVNLVVSKKPQTVRIDGKEYSCKVIREADLQLAFFLYEGELIQMRDDGQDLLFQKTL